MQWTYTVNVCGCFRLVSSIICECFKTANFVVDVPSTMPTFVMVVVLGSNYDVSRGLGLVWFFKADINAIRNNFVQESILKFNQLYCSIWIIYLKNKINSLILYLTSHSSFYNSHFSFLFFTSPC